MVNKKLISDRIFTVANLVTKKSIGASSKVVGAKCELFYPRAPIPDDVPQVFKNDSQNWEYSLVPDITKALIVQGLFGDTFRASDSSFDNYNADSPYIQTDMDFKIPKNTKVKIYRGENIFIMKVVEHNVYPSTQKGQIYYKNFIASFN